MLTRNVTSTQARDFLGQSTTRDQSEGHSDIQSEGHSDIQLNDSQTYQQVQSENVSDELQLNDSGAYEVCVIFYECD